jgi:hypothetical protein
MVNNSTNINQANNHINSLNIEKITTYNVGNPGSGTKTWRGLTGYRDPNTPLLIIGYPTAIHIYTNDNKLALTCFHSK